MNEDERIARLETAVAEMAEAMTATHLDIAALVAVVVEGRAEMEEYRAEVVAHRAQMEEHQADIVRLYAAWPEQMRSSAAVMDELRLIRGALSRIEGRLS